MVDKVLIVNYDFPPNDGIGGRRWAKLAKGLAVSGVSVFIVKADSLPAQANSPWKSDAQQNGITTKSLPRMYPTVLQSVPTTFVGKVLYKWQKFRLHRKYKGTIYDISLGWEKVFIPAVKEICATHGIRTIMATGAPWNMLWELAKLVEQNKELKLLVDFRDPWIGARNYGMLGLNEQRLNFEKNKQLFVLEKASWVVTPYNHLTELLRAFAPESTAMFSVLPHFFDEADFVDIKPSFPNQEVRLTYGGEMYVECEEQLIWLDEMLSRLHALDLSLYENLYIDFYTPTDRSAYFTSHQQVVFHKPIGKAIIDKYASSTALLLLLTKSKKDDLTTKFFEYLPMHKPVIGLGVDGEVSQFVKEQSMGLHWGPNVSFEQFHSDVEQLIKGPLEIKKQVDLRPYELKYAVQKLRDLIQ